MIKRTKNRVTLDLEGPKITSDRFARAVVSFLELLDEVSKEATGERGAVRWIVSVRPGSVHLAAVAEALKPSAPLAEITKAIATGMRTMERRASRPKYFSDAALNRARDLASVVDGREVERAAIRVDEGAVVVSKRTAGHVDSILAVYAKDYGTVEGKLEMISMRGGPHFAVYDPLTDRPVSCFVKTDQMQTAFQSFGKRVAVSGLIRYRKDGEPVSIEVEDIATFPDAAALPTAEDVYGILTSTG